MAQFFGANGWGLRMVGMSQLRNMLEEIRVQFDGSNVYVVGPQTEYAVYHELGTSHMSARPFMRPAAEDVQSDMAGWIQRISGNDGFDSEEEMVRSVALAVETRAKEIAREKGVEDTGATIASIEARQT